MSEICRKEKIVFQDAVRLMKEIYGIDMEANGQRSKLISGLRNMALGHWKNERALFNEKLFRSINSCPSAHLLHS